MCLIIHIHVVDKYSFGIVYHVGSAESANVIHGILQVESVAAHMVSHVRVVPHWPIAFPCRICEKENCVCNVAL